jgi:SAM-dependent methyltransferase
MPSTCLHCGSEAFPAFRTGDINRRLSQQLFQYFGCKGCGLIFLWPVPANLNDYYPDDYYYIPASREQLALLATGERYKLEIVQRFVQAGRLLDIGPATGGFAYWAKEAGFEVDTIEMDSRCCEFLRDVVGVQAIESADVPAALHNAGPYDVITLWQVIEHLADPWEVLAAAAHRLAPNGILVIAAPNPGSLQFRLFGRRWTHLDAPRHLVLVPIPLVLEQAARLGLDPLLVTTRDEGTLGWNEFGWHHSLENMAPLGNRIRVTRIPRRVMRELATRANRWLVPLERSGLRGSTYTIVLQKGPRA